LLLDEVFGPGNFRSEIIWHYRRWSSSRRGLLPAHQTILYYTKTDQFIFNETFTEYSPTTNVDQILQRRSRDAFNKSVYDRDENGNAVPSGAKRGVPLGDVWEIPFLNPKAKERTGYPTQKPLQLLERIVVLATEIGSCVIDPFCGSGTTLVAAQHLGRSALGIDLSDEAVNLTRARLQEPIRSESRLLEIGREAYRNADDFALSYLKGLEFVPVQRNSGIDVILKRTFGGGPVPVRVQRPNESIFDAAERLFRACTGKGAKVMFLVVTARGGCFDFATELPDGVIAIESPAISILEQLDTIIGEEIIQH
jgi:site-specific DNA-methyltransferase (adenine-specific)